MLTAERNRLGHVVGVVRRDLREHMRWLERRLADLDRDLDIFRPRRRPTKADAPLIEDPDTVLALPVALERFQMIAGW